MNAAYMKALTEVTKELESVIAERRALDLRILRLQQTRATLFRLTGMEIPDHIVNKGMTDAIRGMLGFMTEETKAIPLDAKKVREALEAIGYDFSHYRNTLASITGTLERLYEAGELKKVTFKRGKGRKRTGYMVAPPATKPSEGEK